MNDNLIKAETLPAPTDSKWFLEISSDQPVCEVASRVLNARLKTVCHALGFAAVKSDENIEHVHRLRISVRRAAEAVRIFSFLIKEAEINALQDWLNRIRRAADEARTWDVMYNRLVQGSGEQLKAKILERLEVLRREAKGPIVIAYQELKAKAVEDKIDLLVRKVESHCHGKGKRRFGRQVSRYLNPVVKKFFKAAESEPTTDEAFHGLRIRAKKLRYTMEIVAVALPTRFHKHLYPQITHFQDLLGILNDHATAKAIFQDWLLQTKDVLDKAFLEGLLFAEKMATKDLQAAFLLIFTPEGVSELKRKFLAYR